MAAATKSKIALRKHPFALATLASIEAGHATAEAVLAHVGGHTNIHFAAVMLKDLAAFGLTKDGALTDAGRMVLAWA